VADDSWIDRVTTDQPARSHDDDAPAGRRTDCNACSTLSPPASGRDSFRAGASEAILDLVNDHI
jgi:hypothetical protein